MKRPLTHRVLSCILGLGMAAVAVLFIARGFAAEKAPAKLPGNIPQVIPPVAVPKENVNIGQPVPANALKLPDLGKGVIEMPTKRLLAGRTAPGAVPPDSGVVNPKVEPGKVRWHKTFDAACTAAKKSGKPVLLFQMMGNLDERFC